jgi:hypothetical protein
MSRSSLSGTILFWAMVLTGAAGLGPALILPAWLEYQAALAARERARQRVSEVEKQLVGTHKQIEHLRNDPAYNERIARTELGVVTPGVETILLDPPRQNEASTATGAAARARSGGSVTAASAPPQPAPEDALAPELSATIAAALQRYPLARIFILDETRPYVMVLSAALLLAAILLLGPSTRPTLGTETRTPQSRRRNSRRLTGED